MKIKSFALGFTCCCLTVILFGVQPVMAVDILGRVDAIHPGGNVTFPASQVRVDLYEFMGTHWQRVATTFTGPDGMYFIRAVPPGTNYFLQLNGISNYPVVVIPANNQSIPPLLLRY